MTAIGGFWRQDLEELAKTARYNARALAKLCNLSTRQLQRRFKRDFGRTPQDWLDERRLKAAQEKLLNGLQVKAVALECGFKQTSHFCRCFKSAYGTTPSYFALSPFARAACRLQITEVAQG